MIDLFVDEIIKKLVHNIFEEKNKSKQTKAKTPKKTTHHHTSEQAMCISPEIFGPPMWRTIHILCYAAPEVLTPKKREKYMTFFLLLAEFLPCDECREHFLTLITKQVPLEAAMQSGTSLFRWSYEAHKNVNTRLGKSTPSFETVLSEMHQASITGRCRNKAVMAAEPGSNLAIRLASASSSAPEREEEEEDNEEEEENDDHLFDETINCQCKSTMMTTTTTTTTDDPEGKEDHSIRNILLISLGLAALGSAAIVAHPSTRRKIKNTFL